MRVGLHDVRADLSALLSVRREDVLSLELGLVNEEMMAVSTQNVLGFHRRLDQLLYTAMYSA